MRNLSATLTLVDRQRPLQSTLLKVPRTPHGGMTKPVFGPHQDQLLKQLIEWVDLVVETQAAEGAPQSGFGAMAGVNAATDGEPIANAAQVSSGAVTVAYETPITPGMQAAGPRYGVQLQPAWRPKDAFDPEIFNRRFGRPANPRGD